MQRSLPIKIDIKPANYIPQVPSPITNLRKTITNTNVTYTWDASAYGGSETPVYIVREADGTPLQLTTARQLVITDTAGSDPVVSFTAAGIDGHSGTVLSSDAAVNDQRVPTSQPPTPAPTEAASGSSNTSPQPTPEADSGHNQPQGSHATSSASSSEAKNPAVSVRPGVTQAATVLLAPAVLGNDSATLHSQATAVTGPAVHSILAPDAHAQVLSTADVASTGAETVQSATSLFSESWVVELVNWLSIILTMFVAGVFFATRRKHARTGRN
jgi:hypothetical protein